MNEEAVVRMGLDASPLAAGLRGVERSMEKSAHQIKEQFRDVKNEIAASLSLGAAIGLIENTFQKVQQISRAAEGAGVSTDFIQTIEAAGRAAGVSGEQIEKMLNKFVQGLPAGSDVEEQFYKTADAIAAIEDPAERARMATEAFGKSGVKMIAILKDGKAGVQDLAAGFGKLSEEEIKAVEEAHVSIEKLESGLTVAAGKTIDFLTTGARLVGNWLGGGTIDSMAADDSAQEHQAKAAKDGALAAEKAAKAAQAESEARNNIQLAIENYSKHVEDIALKSKATTFEEKSAILQNRLEKAKAELGDSLNMKEVVDGKTKVLDLENEILELNRKQSDEVAKANDKAEKERDKEMQHLEALADKRDKAANSLADARKSPYEYSLEDLAKSNGFESGDARDVVQLRDWAKWNFMHGNTEKGEWQKNRAEDIFDRLAKDQPYLKNPYEKMIDELKKANDTLDDFYDNGMPVYGAED